MSEADPAVARTPDRVLVGRYHLTRFIASGGMAEVWEGRDNLLARPVAIKMPLAHVARQEQAMRRFRREAVAAARLSHPNVVSVYDTGTDGPDSFIVMERVDGVSLRQLLESRRPLPVDQAVAMAAQVAGALDFAHRAGLVHRDVKPANILVTPDGVVKVTDFGIAKAVMDEDLTQTNATLGTARYVAPEQVEGGPADGRSDVYALGVVLYEMLCGRPPFEAESEFGLAMKHLRETPAPPSTRRNGVPDWLEQAVLKALAKDPTARFDSAGDLQAALRQGERSVDGAEPSSWSAGHQAGSAPSGSTREGPGGSGANEGSPRGATVTGPTPEEGVRVGGGTGTGASDEMPWTFAASGSAARGSTTVESSEARRGAASDPGGRTRVVPDDGPTDSVGRWRPGEDPDGETALDGSWPPSSPSAVSTSVEAPPFDRGSDRRAAGPERGQHAKPRVRRRLLPLVVAAVAVAGLVVAGILVARLRSGGHPTPATGGSPSTSASGAAPASGTTPHAIAVVSGVSFDPRSDGGDGSEDPAGIPNLFDHNPATVWQTNIYYNRHFGNLKPGVGFILHLGRSRHLASLTLLTSTLGWKASVYLSEASPATVGGWGAPVAQATASGSSVPFALGGHQGSNVLVWFTLLGPDRTVKIGEASLTGR